MDDLNHVLALDAYETIQEAMAGDDPVRRGIAEQGLQLTELLLRKNSAYGNSALDPVRVFSKADPEEQLYVRIDDKLSRVMRGNAYAGDNDVQDLAGYLVLLLVHRDQQA